MSLVTSRSRTDGTVSGVSPRRQRLVLTGELAALAGLLVADAWGLVPLSRTPFLLVLCWLSLHLRRARWRDIGFSRPTDLTRAVGIGVAAGAGIELLALFITTPLIAIFIGAPPDVSDLKAVVGNLQVLLIVFALSWVVAAFGEEIVFRGYLMHRVAELFGGSRGAWAASLVVASVYFGIGHATQGTAGVVQESLSGFWLGVLFLASGRNLTIPIVAHGVSNTIALVLIYLNRYPGLS